MPSTRMGNQRRGVFYGWWILAAGTMVWALQSGTYYLGFGAFFTALTEEFGWSRTSLSIVVSTAKLQNGVAAPVVGFLIDRIGPRRLMATGFALAGTGFIFLSQANSIEVFSLIFVLLLSVGASLGFAACASAAVANWFVRRRGLAFGIMMSGFGIGGLIVPAIAWSIGRYGWRFTAIACGVLLLVSGGPLAMVLRHRPETYGYLPDGDDPTACGRDGPAEGSVDKPSATLAKTNVRGQASLAFDGVPGFTPKQALTCRAFWTFSIMSAARQVVTSGIGIHGIPALENMGFSREAAAGVMTAMTLMSVPGRLFFGELEVQPKTGFETNCCGQDEALDYLCSVRSAW